VKPVITLINITGEIVEAASVEYVAFSLLVRSSDDVYVSCCRGAPLPTAAAPSQPMVVQGSDTICPECGLKDDGSPMIGNARTVRDYVAVGIGGWGHSLEAGNSMI